MKHLEMELKNLQEQLQFLQSENVYLRQLLSEHHISYQYPPAPKPLLPQAISKEDILLFYSYFHGRKDVFSLRSVRKDGTAAYYPVCTNFWKYGICPRCEKKQIKCSQCPSRAYKSLTQRDLWNHLTGSKENCTDVIGVYPMMQDDTCFFLVFDFDEHSPDADSKGQQDWKRDVDALRGICEELHVPALVERSRSGHGAHVWLFFEEAISAALARKFGSALLTKGAELVNQTSFVSYDRMIPAQDSLPEGSIGNLVALPLQGRAVPKGNSVFVDEHWKPYPNQLETLKGTPKLKKDCVEERIREWSVNGVLGTLATTENDEEQKPWKKPETAWKREHCHGELLLTIADQLYISKENLKPRLQNQLRRLAAFSNPDFYKKQAMGFSTYGTPRIIYCGSDTEKYICLPRGCLEKVQEQAKTADIPVKMEDERNYGNEICVTFQGTLYPEQQAAAEKMLSHENGILAAATAFGKTAVGSYLVAARKVNTLILVHNREIMKNWVEDFEKFLVIDEDLPTYQTPSGRVKHRKSLIGTLYASHNSLTGIIDVAMIGSLGKKDEISGLVKNYGMVIMDECHHSGAQTADNVMRAVNAKYVYGLTATPKRDDGREQQVYFQFGGIRYRFTAKDKAI